MAALVVGDMLGTGILFTPGELASVAESPWQVYFFWGLCGVITLCGALTLAELTTLLPRAGASYHVIREAFGPFAAFLKIWVEMWVSGPGSVAGVAIVLGEFAVRLPGAPAGIAATTWGAVAIAAFALVNLGGVTWGGRTQVGLTVAKVVGLLALVLGSLLLAAPAAPAVPAAAQDGGASLLGFVRLVGLGVAAVLFTYDGWVDVTHVAGEVKEPARHLPLAVLDEKLCLIFEESLRVFPCRLYEARRTEPRHVLFSEFLEERGFTCIPITQEERRDGHLNVVVTERSRRAVGFAAAARVKADMARRGFELATFPADELFMGRGGAHCMTCPLLVR